MKQEQVLYKIKSLYEVILRNIIHNNQNHLKNFKKRYPTPTQMQIIKYIIDNKDNDIYQKDLENILNLRRATVSGVLKTMEKNNLIIRIDCNFDARVKKIILTENTKKFFKNSKEQFDKMDYILTNNIDKHDLEIFLKVIDKMKNNLENI